MIRAEMVNDDIQIEVTGDGLTLVKELAELLNQFAKEKQLRPLMSTALILNGCGSLKEALAVAKAMAEVDKMAEVEKMEFKA